MTNFVRLAFGTNRARLDVFNVLTDIVDVCFALDMILTFFVAIRQPDGTIVTDKQTIVMGYLKYSIFNVSNPIFLRGLFFIDLLTILPWEFFLPHLSFLKLMRVIHLGRFFGHMNQFTDLVIYLS